MSVIMHEETTFDINPLFFSNYKNDKKSFELYIQILIKEYSILFINKKPNEKQPTFEDYITKGIYKNISNYARIIDYDNCVKCLLMNVVRIKESKNADVKRELRSINNLLACLATYCKDCPEGITPKDFL